MRKESERNIILIGGAPTAGKSTMARLLSERLGIPWISTDQIRRIMRVAARREDTPNLFTPEGYTAERFLTEFSAEEIVRMEMEQGEAVWAGVKKFIEEGYPWNGRFIIEGVHILPHLITRDFGDNQDIRSVFFVDEDADRIRDVVFTRGLWDDARTYSDDVKEKEIEWALLFSNKIKAEAEEYGYPCVEVTKSHDDVDAVLRLLEG